MPFGIFSTLSIWFYWLVTYLLLYYPFALTSQAMNDAC